MSVDEPSRGSRAILFPEAVFSHYGLGRLEVSAAGITIRWSGWLWRNPDRSSPWTEVKSVRLRGHWVDVRLSTQLPILSAFVFRVRPTRDALAHWAAPKGVPVTG
jgi:hypothetical protein